MRNVLVPCDVCGKCDHNNGWWWGVATSIFHSGQSNWSSCDLTGQFSHSTHMKSSYCVEDVFKNVNKWKLNNQYYVRADATAMNCVFKHVSGVATAVDEESRENWNNQSSKLIEWERDEVKQVFALDGVLLMSKWAWKLRGKPGLGLKDRRIGFGRMSFDRFDLIRHYSCVKLGIHECQ